MKLSTGKKTEKLNYDKNKERSYFFSKAGKRKAEQAYIFYLLFLFLKTYKEKIKYEKE